MAMVAEAIKSPHGLSSYRREGNYVGAGAVFNFRSFIVAELCN